MRLIFQYIGRYFYETDKRVLTATTVWMAIMVFLNYEYGIDDSISRGASWGTHFVYRYFIYAMAFALPYLFYYMVGRMRIRYPKPFFVLLAVAPAIFSLKVALRIPLQLAADAAWNRYWNYIIYWPFLVLLTMAFLWILWRIFDRDQPFYGLRTKNINWKPYWLMLLIMVPLVAAASTQPDFLEMYPKLKTIEGLYQQENMQWWHKVLYELSYGTDFITIEFFFRGFLVLAFIKWAGKHAILPMACFYCTIHFGKPLGECISSYFGGLLLGVIVYHTRSVLGGLLVHVGIAWLMELGGYLGNKG